MSKFGISKLSKFRKRRGVSKNTPKRESEDAPKKGTSRLLGMRILSDQTSRSVVSPTAR